MAQDPDLPRRGSRITTADGDWQVLDVMLLGRTPLHYAVRVLGPAGPAGGSRLAVVLSRLEFEALQAKASGQGSAKAPASRPRR